MDKQKKSPGAYVRSLKKTKFKTFFRSKNKKNIVKHNTTEKNKYVFPSRKNPLDYFENEFKLAGISLFFFTDLIFRIAPFMLNIS